MFLLDDKHGSRWLGIRDHKDNTVTHLYCRLVKQTATGWGTVDGALLRRSDLTPVYRIVEEVPCVPPGEQYFVTGGDWIPGQYPHFATKAEAIAFLAQHGITRYEFEPFEP